MEAPAVDEPLVPIDHPRFHQTWAAVFTRRVTPDCMTHSCEMIETHHKRLDVCCQYGCDTDIAERDAILARKDQIGALMKPAAAATPWFEEEVWEDADYPSGKVVRSTVLDDACIFLAHDQRGCAIHRASLEQGWDMNGVKPAICRLFPLSYEADTIIIADEFPEYLCAHVDGPTIYRYARDAIGALFGFELVDALDAAEAHVLSAPVPPPPVRLPVLR